MLVLRAYINTLHEQRFTPVVLDMNFNYDAYLLSYYAKNLHTDPKT